MPASMTLLVPHRNIPSSAHSDNIVVSSPWWHLPRKISFPIPIFFIETRLFKIFGWQNPALLVIFLTEKFSLLHKIFLHHLPIFVPKEDGLQMFSIFIIFELPSDRLFAWTYFYFPRTALLREYLLKPTIFVSPNAQYRSTLIVITTLSIEFSFFVFSFLDSLAIILQDINSFIFPLFHWIFLTVSIGVVDVDVVYYI